MRKSFRVCVAAVVALFLADASIAPQSSEAAEAAKCLAKPTGAAPKGQHWYFNSDPQTKRRCWYLAQAGLKIIGRKGALPRAVKHAAKVSRTRFAKTAAPPPPKPDNLKAVIPAQTEPEQSSVTPDTAAPDIRPDIQTATGKIDEPAAGTLAPGAVLAQAFPIRRRASASVDEEMTGSRADPIQESAQTTDETEPAADSVWPELPAQTQTVASVLPATPGTMLTILVGALLLAGIALRGIMIAVRQPSARAG